MLPKSMHMPKLYGRYGNIRPSQLQYYRLSCC